MIYDQFSGSLIFSIFDLPISEVCLQKFPDLLFQSLNVLLTGWRLVVLVWLIQMAFRPLDLFDSFILRTLKRSLKDRKTF